MVVQGGTWLAFAFVAATALAGGPTGCGDDGNSGGDGGYHPTIDPAHFSATIDHPFFPFAAGTVRQYTEASESDVQDITVTVTNDTRVVDGVTCLVVRDVASQDTDVLEDTYDWYAQDDDGNVWYFGEDTTEYDGEQTSTAGSWEAGVDGAEPGIVMEADPQVGDQYRQEFLAGQAEDMAEILALGESASVPFGDFDDCVRTRDFTALEPDQVEEKLYCRDVGEVQADLVHGGVEHEELVSVTTE